MQKLSGMKKADIEQLIRKYVRDNHREHPTVFPESLIELTEIAKELAQSYWEHNTRSESKRDKQAGVTVEHYIEWVISELITLKKAQLYN
jgi:hypothetical protein